LGNLCECLNPNICERKKWHNKNYDDKIFMARPEKLMRDNKKTKKCHDHSSWHNNQGNYKYKNNYAYATFMAIDYVPSPSRKEKLKKYTLMGYDILGNYY
jgi:hypothetical protein